MTDPSREQLLADLNSYILANQLLARQVEECRERSHKLAERIRKVRELARGWSSPVEQAIRAALDGEDEEQPERPLIDKTWSQDWDSKEGAVYDEKPPRANGGILPGGVIYQVGESGCELPRTETVRFGDHEIRVVVDLSCPPDLLLAIGSCGCGHPVTGHGENGCVTPGSVTGAPCPCVTPVSRLVAGAKIARERSQAEAPADGEDEEQAHGPMA